MVSAYETENDGKLKAVQLLEASKKRLNKLYQTVEQVSNQIKELSERNPQISNTTSNVTDVNDQHVITEEEINRVDLSEYKAELEANLEHEMKIKEGIQKAIQQQIASGGKAVKPTKLNQELQAVERNIETRKKEIEKFINVSILIN